MVCGVALSKFHQDCCQTSFAYEADFFSNRFCVYIPYATRAWWKWHDAHAVLEGCPYQDRTEREHSTTVPDRKELLTNRAHR